jgi:hypothetical protein
LVISKTLLNLCKGKMNRWTSKGRMVPQHNSLQDHRLHRIQAPVWWRGNVTGRDQTSEPPHHKASHGWRWIILKENNWRNQIRGYWEHRKVPAADQKMERQPSCEKKHTRWGLGPQKQSKHSTRWKAIAKVGRPLHRESIQKTWVILPDRWRRQNLSPHPEHR